MSPLLSLAAAPAKQKRAAIAIAAAEKKAKQVRLSSMSVVKHAERRT